MTRYRPDIDGLRAIAILSVIAFHFGIPFAKAGFSGVDMFFVISGYLICGSSLQKIETIRDIGEFFRRRVARLLPMLALTTVIVLALAIARSPWAEAHLALRTSRSVVSFASNLYFWSKADYFQSAGRSNPFTPTWSLAVEEQFYLVIPFVLFFAGRWRRSILLFGSIVSLGLAVWIAKPPGAFYLLPCRAWELGCGALLVGLTPPRWPRAVVSLGILAILVGLALMSPSLSQSPAYRLFPVLGTAAIIWGNHRENSLTRWIGWAPLAFIGSMSYSAYLIHWPIWVFIALPEERLVPPLFVAGLVILTFVTAWLAFRFIEKPAQIRMRTWRPRWIVATLLIFIFSVRSVTARLDAILPPPPAGLSAGEQVGTCFLRIDQSAKGYDVRHCIPQGLGEKWLLWGDSHAAHFYASLVRSAPDSVRVFQATKAGCAPMADETVSHHCRGFDSFVLDSLVPIHAPNVVFISSHWSRDEKMNGPEKLRALLTDAVSKIKRSSGRVVLMLETPEFEGNVRMILDRRKYGIDRSDDVWFPAIQFHQLNERLRRVCEDLGIECYDPTAEMCREKECLAGRKGKPLWIDGSHLSRDGAAEALRALPAFMGK